MCVCDPLIHPKENKLCIMHLYPSLYKNSLLLKIKFCFGSFITSLFRRREIINQRILYFHIYCQLNNKNVKNKKKDSPCSVKWEKDVLCRASADSTGKMRVNFLSHSHSQALYSTQHYIYIHIRTALCRGH